MRRINGRIRKVLFDEFSLVMNFNSPVTVAYHPDGRVAYKEKFGRVFTSLTNQELNKLKVKYKLPDSVKKNQAIL